MTEEEDLAAGTAAKDSFFEPTEEDAVSFAIQKLTTIADAYDKLDAQCPGCGTGTPCIRRVTSTLHALVTCG